MTNTRRVAAQNRTSSASVYGRKQKEAKNRLNVVPCKYKVGRLLGRGYYSMVKEMMHIETGQQYAGKIISKHRMRDAPEAIKKEINMLKRLSRTHPNLVTLVDHFETQNNTYVITELCTGGELFEYIYQRSSLEEPEAAHIMRQIVEGVAFLHDHGIMHRDIKPENCLVRADEFGAPVSVAIGDFGMADFVPPPGCPLPNKLCGTDGYMAPEMILQIGHSTPIDMWAVGVTAYFMLSGTNPFPRAHKAEHAGPILTGSYSFLPHYRWRNVSPVARDFIASLLAVDPAKRMTARQALEHPWLRNCKLDTARLESSLVVANTQLADTHSSMHQTLNQNLFFQECAQKNNGQYQGMTACGANAGEDMLQTKHQLTESQLNYFQANQNYTANTYLDELQKSNMLKNLSGEHTDLDSLTRCPSAADGYANLTSGANQPYKPLAGIPECVFQPESADESLKNSSSETATDPSSQGPGGLTKLMMMQRNVASSIVPFALETEQQFLNAQYYHKNMGFATADHSKQMGINWLVTPPASSTGTTTMYALSQNK
ncbi:Calcium/calmodulin-dependent protein kinase type I [Coemansia guatemalensis]|uniref:Calcium/calmodulin-dependent protein kinase type I n=1 Tax=Coemansia guatemalensis TaxID=2761395 RepID=A0A9W8HZP9_9FUNG|nr:Calcium/calmodulin-dependent protein kinase type I [Coemansia guatemalensis]